MIDRLDAGDMEAERRGVRGYVVVKVQLGVRRPQDEHAVRAAERPRHRGKEAILVRGVIVRRRLMSRMPQDMSGRPDRGRREGLRRDVKDERLLMVNPESRLMKLHGDTLALQQSV